MADVKINITANNQASRPIEDVSKSLKGLGDAAEEAGQGAQGMGLDWTLVLTGINQGLEIAQKAIEAFKRAYDFAKEGAELQYLETRFDNLSKSIGTTSSALLGDLKQATRGLVSDADLMTGATNMMALGLAKTHDEAVRLSNVAGALGMNMDQLTLTLTNQTIRRFDTLGVSVDGFTEKVKALEAAGMSADDAFKEAFLQKAEEQIGGVGHAADNAIGSFMKFEAALDNSRTAAMRNVNEMGLLPDILNDVADNTNALIEQQNLLSQAYDLGIIDQDEYNHSMMILGQTGKANQTIISELSTAIDEAAKAAELARRMTDPYSESMDLAAEAAGRLATSTELVRDATNDANEAMRSYNATLLFKMASENLSSEAALELARTMGLVDERTVYATEQLAIYKQALDTGKISVDTYKTLVAGLADQMDRIKDKSATISISWRETGQPSPAAMQYLQPYVNFDAAGGAVHGINQAAGGMINAAGGAIHAAAGLSARPAMHWVGEIGPEPFFPSQSGRILSNTEAKQAMRESTAVRGDAPITVVINTPFNFADEVWVERELAPYIRKEIRETLRT